MKISKKANSIAEALVVMLIIVVGVVGMYQMYSASLKLQISTQNKIKAIQIAKEGIEAMTNIRDTNFILFGGDYKNCWNTLNYNNLCLGDTSQSYDIQQNGKYIISPDTNNRWYISSPSGVTDYSFMTPEYKNAFQVFTDNNGLYTQTGASGTKFEIKPLFTREIRINYIDTDGVNGANSNDEKMEVSSIVQWMDSSSNHPHKIALKTILSNWKK